MWSLTTPLLLLLVFLVVHRLNRKLEASKVEGAETGPALALSSIAITLLIGGLLQQARLLFLSQRWTLDSARLTLLALGAAAAVVAALVVAALVLVGRALRWRMLVYELILTAGVGTLATTGALLRDLNMELDSKPAVPREARIINLHRSTSLRGGTNYVMRLEDWTHEGTVRELDLSRSQYNQFAIGETVQFEEHPGALGLRWVGELRGGGH